MTWLRCSAKTICGTSIETSALQSSEGTGDETGCKGAEREMTPPVATAAYWRLNLRRKRRDGSKPLEVVEEPVTTAERGSKVKDLL